MKIETQLTKQLGIEYPIICGAMYPCSNPELIASVSEAGGIGIVQPISLTYVYGYTCRDGIKKIKSLTNKPFGFNVIVEKSQKIYEDRMKQWIDIAIEEGCKFFITALGNPKWVVDKVSSAGGIVYHDVTEKKWALKALDSGVQGLICVNNRAGGHAGSKSPQDLYSELKDLNVPLICAGGIGDEQDFVRALKTGYAGVQMGTRFIATKECASKNDYKEAIVKAEENDIVLTERVTGVPLAVIKTPYLEKIGVNAGPIAKFLLKHRKTKHWMRTFYSLQSVWKLKKSTLKGASTKDFYQAGKSVAGIEKVESSSDIVKRFANSWSQQARQ